MAAEAPMAGVVAAQVAERHCANERPASRPPRPCVAAGRWCAVSGCIGTNLECINDADGEVIEAMGRNCSAGESRFTGDDFSGHGNDSITTPRLMSSSAGFVPQGLSDSDGAPLSRTRSTGSGRTMYNRWDAVGERVVRVNGRTSGQIPLSTRLEFPGRPLRAPMFPHMLHGSSRDGRPPHASAVV